MEDSATLVFASVTLGQIALCVSILVSRAHRNHVYVPLTLFLFAVGWMICGGWIVTSPGSKSILTAFSLPALLALAPSLWLYTLGLTSETLWQLRKSHALHYGPAVVGLVIAMVGAMLPSEMRHALLIEGQESGLKLGSERQNVIALVAVCLAFMLIVFWVFQSAYYLFKSARRLTQYRNQLKDLFASTETRELRWLSALLVFLGVSWCICVLVFLANDAIPDVGIPSNAMSIVVCVTLWMMCAWGLRQKPGFEELYRQNQMDLLRVSSYHDRVGSSTLGDESGTDVIDDFQQVLDRSDNKYKRSALDQAQSERIARKIRSCMNEDKLYLDAALSLQKLAQHLAVSPNYISQTLNETIGKNFFDFINGYRVEAAKPMIKAGDETVLDVAMAVGFNARSSFYTAFKKEVGMTPSVYKKT